MSTTYLQQLTEFQEETYWQPVSITPVVNITSQKNILATVVSV
jgi:hypothetical protein